MGMIKNPDGSIFIGDEVVDSSINDLRETISDFIDEATSNGQSVIASSDEE